MKYAKKIVKAGWGIRVYGKYRGVMVVVHKPGHETLYVERSSLEDAMRDAWKGINAAAQ